MQNKHITPDGYVAYDTVVAGYSFRVFVTPSGHYQYGAPFGTTPKDVAMFDDLVYHHSDIYNGTDPDKIERDITKFILNYHANL